MFLKKYTPHNFSQLFYSFVDHILPISYSINITLLLVYSMTTSYIFQANKPTNHLHLEFDR